MNVWYEKEALYHVFVICGNATTKELDGRWTHFDRNVWCGRWKEGDRRIAGHKIATFSRRDETKSRVSQKTVGNYNTGYPAFMEAVISERGYFTLRAYQRTRHPSLLPSSRLI